MIENIHSHEGEDKRYQNNVNYAFKPPKNIKQIGESTSQKKIYVEDYVFTYIKELAKKEYANCKIAVLLGRYIKTPESKTIVINGAVEAQGVHFDAENVFTNDTWTSVYEKIKQYFHEVEVVGWFIGGPGFILENADKLRKIHLDNFAGVDKTMLKYDSIEGEEAFYIYEHGALCKQAGYYIYYEKNDDMQNYIISNQSAVPVKTTEERREEVVQEYKEEEKEHKAEENGKSVMHLMYAAGSLMVMLVIVIATTIINNNSKIDELESTVNNMKDSMQTAVVQEDTSGQESIQSDADVTTGQTEGTGEIADAEVTDGDEASETMNVETIPGNLDTVKDEEVIGDKAQPDGSDAQESSQETGEDNKADTDVSDASDTKTDSAQKDTESTDKKDTETADTQDAKSSEEKDSEEDETDDDKTDKKDSADTNSESGKEDSKETSTTSEANYYIVKDGDTLASICYKLYNSIDNINRIIEMNGIEDADHIVTGQKLLVP